MMSIRILYFSTDHMQSGQRTLIGTVQWIELLTTCITSKLRASTQRSVTLKWSWILISSMSRKCVHSSYWWLADMKKWCVSIRLMFLKSHSFVDTRALIIIRKIAMMTYAICTCTHTVTHYNTRCDSSHHCLCEENRNPWDTCLHSKRLSVRFAQQNHKDTP